MLCIHSLMSDKEFLNSIVFFADEKKDSKKKKGKKKKGKGKKSSKGDEPVRSSSARLNEYTLIIRSDHNHLRFMGSNDLCGSATEGPTATTKKCTFTVVVKSIHTAGCIKRNGQLLTLANNNLVGSDCQEITHDVIIPPYQNGSESITVNKVFQTKESQLQFWGVQKWGCRINFCSTNLMFQVQGL